MTKDPDPQNQVVLRLRLRPEILFLGCIDGEPELDFLRLLGHSDYNVHLTSYGSAPAELTRLHNTRHLAASIRVEGNVDATNLEYHYPANQFDIIVWIGPTYDGHLDQTSELVGAFVRSAGRVLRQGGIVCVVQDLKTPNFRNILGLNGAVFCGTVNLEGRTQTQHSAKKVKFEDRNDQLVCFTFHGGNPVDINDQLNQEFTDLISNKIMKLKAKDFNIKESFKKYNPNFRSKKDLADLIFDFAGMGIRQRPPAPTLTLHLAPPTPNGPAVYSCPTCVPGFASSGPGHCWKCGKTLEKKTD